VIAVLGVIAWLVGIFLLCWLVGTIMHRNEIDLLADPEPRVENTELDEQYARVVLGYGDRYRDVRRVA